MFGHRQGLGLVIVACAAWVSVAQAQTRPWVQYSDSGSDAVCGLIHGGNAEFVVARTTGEMVKVTGPDITLVDLTVDEQGNVTYQDELAGFIEFDVDGDGLRALFWLTLSGHLVDIDPFDASVSESDLVPTDVHSTGCDGCALWDDATACDDNENTNDNSNGNDNSNDGGNSPIFNVLCGAGSGTGAAMAMAVLLAGRGLSTVRRGRSRDEFQSN
jgi:hypothetical protein